MKIGSGCKQTVALSTKLKTSEHDYNEINPKVNLNLKSLTSDYFR